MKFGKKRVELSEDEIKEQVKNGADEAEELLKDPNKMEKFLERLERKLKKIPVLGEGLSTVPMMVSLVRSYMKKEYTEIPMGSIIAIVVGLGYFLSPVDLIPDAIPGVGYLDDGAVIIGVIKLVHDDVAEYEEWQRKNGKRVLEENDKKNSK